MRKSPTGTAGRVPRPAAIGLALLLGLMLGASRLPAQPRSADDGLLELSLEELSNLRISSVAKRPQRLLESPASVYVITAEQIRRSGANSLPEALRLAPNLQVARVDANRYAISARGFTSTAANKLLVLIDGRTVYTPLFSGVFWDVQDVALDEIERIEVISGPGATVWGSNAVNGVINVLTRHARDSQGGLLGLGVGDEDSQVNLRYGGRIGADGHYRVYGKYFERDHSRLADGSPVVDAWDKGQAGFRVDLERDGRRMMLQGNVYQGAEEQSGPGTRELRGLNLLGRWERMHADGETRLQLYYDRTERDHPGVFAEELDILDLEYQRRWSLSRAQELTWGAGYRLALDRVQNSAMLAFLPAEKTLHWANLFLQDEIQLAPRWRLTLGGRIEHNDYTGIELLPNLRLAWQLTPESLLWGSLSRAVRSPSRLDRELFAPAEPPFLLAGGPGFESEQVDSLELGYRALVSQRLSYSLTLFHHEYDRLRTVEPSVGGFVIDNKLGGHADGLEGWGSLQATPTWRLSAGFTLLRQRLRLDADSSDINAGSGESNDPSHQWLLRSSLDLPGARELDLSLRRVGKLPDPQVPAYTALDVRLGWRPTEELELSLNIRNLLDDSHPEFGAAASRSEIERSIFGQLRWRF